MTGCRSHASESVGRSERSPDASKPAQAFCLGEQLQPAPRRAAGPRRALKYAAGYALPGAFKAHPQVDLLALGSDEAAAELLLQLRRGCFRKGPPQDRQVKRL